MVVIKSYEKLKDNEKYAENVVYKQEKDFELLKQIYEDPESVISDENVMDNVVNIGYHATALCDALGVKKITVEVKGQEYTLRQLTPPPGLTTYNVLMRDSPIIPINMPDPIKDYETVAEQEKEKYNPTVDIDKLAVKYKKTG